MQLDLRTIPAGSFRMGSESGLPDERPVHEVWVDEFALAVHPVTNAEYRRFLAATGRPADAAHDDPRFQAPRQPVVAVSWFDAVAFCEWLAATTGLPCRLPTEAEREKAALGGRDGALYPWGDTIDAPSAPPAAGPPEVGGPTNGFALCNMADGVHEWCFDWYAADWYAHSPRSNPTGPADGTRRASRGGSWRHRVRVTRCAARSGLRPDLRYTDYGFRVAVGPHHSS